MTKKQQMTNIFILALAIITLFGYLDAQQIIPWQQLQNWEPYNTFVAPAIINMWLIALAGIAITYYIIKKDKSEAVGIFAASYIMLIGGLQDVSFFILSSNVMTPQMCWFEGTHAIVSKLLGEACVTPLSLWINTALFIGVAWFVLKWFFNRKW